MGSGQFVHDSILKVMRGQATAAAMEHLYAEQLVEARQVLDRRVSEFVDQELDWLRSVDALLDVLALGAGRRAIREIARGNQSGVDAARRELDLIQRAGAELFRTLSG